MQINHFYPVLFLFFSAVSLHAQQHSSLGAEFKKKLFETNHQISNPGMQIPLKLKSAGVKYRLDSLTSRNPYSGNWNINTTDYYTYNSRSLLKSIYSVITSQNDDLSEYFYNSAGLLEMQIVKDGDSLTSNWMNITKFIYDYNTDSSLNYTKLFSWNSNSNLWVPYDSTYQLYNNAGQIKTITTFEWNFITNSWNNQRKTDYFYNGGQLSNLFTHEWDANSASWQASFSCKYSLNSASYILSWASAIYRPATSNWDSVFRAEYTYDVNYNPTKEIYKIYNFNSQHWANYIRYTYDYNLSISTNDLIASSHFQFVPYEREKIINQPLSYQIAIWDSSNVQWNAFDSSTYHYSQQSINLAETENPEWKCYPNPATGQVYFQFPDSKPARVEIYNSAGQIVLKSNVTNSRSLDINSLKAGAYTYQLYFGEERQQGKLMVE